MPQHTLYAYVDGSDLHGIAESLESEFVRFLSEAKWVWGKPWVVNQIREDDPSLGPDDLPDWELGLNMHLPDPGDEPFGWFSDVERIAIFLGQLHAKTGRDFVIGIGDNERGFSEDLIFVKRSQPDLVTLPKRSESKTAVANQTNAFPRSHAPRGNARWRRSASRPVLARDAMQSVRTLVPTQERGNEKRGETK